MKIPPFSCRSRTRIKTVTRFCARLIAGAGLLLVIAFASAVLWLRYVTLPHVETWRPEIVASIEKASGMDVDIRRLQGGWYGLRPSLSMEGFKLRDRKGKAVLAFARAEVTLSWWALLRGEVRFHEIDLDRPELVLRRGADGLVYLADKPLNAADPGDDGAFSRWLLAQPSLQVHEATLTWRDEKAGGPEVRLDNVEINVRRKGSHHLAALTGTPPRDLAGPIDLRADLLIERQGERWDVSGSVYGTSPRTDLARLREVLPLPEAVRSGVGGLRAWASFNAEGVREITADINLRDVKAQLAADALPLELASVSGRAAYRAEPSGFYFGTEGLRFRTASGIEAKPASFSVLRGAAKGQGPRGEVRADGIDLKIAAALVEYFPVPRDLKDQVLRFAPRGLITKAALTWTGESPANATALEIRGTFDDLAINAVDGYPGAAGLTGSLEGNERGGTVRLASRDATFELARIFRAPLRVDTLDARARWKRNGEALEVSIDEARFANADAQGAASGTWRSMPGTEHARPGFLDLKGTFSRVDARAVAGYMPVRFEVTQRWLDAAILSGHSPRASFEAKGNLWHFPWRDNQEGRFVFEGDLKDARLKYHPDWPSIDAIEGSVRFEGTRMEIRADSGAIFASRVKKTTAVIADLSQKPPVLEIAGDVDTAGADTARFLRETPLVNGPGAFTRAIQVEGPARLGLKMTYPLWGVDPVRLAGEYQFAGATATVGKALSISNVKGKLAFTERSVRAPELTGSMFGNPAVVRIASQPDGSVVTQLEGRIATPILGAYVPEPIAARLDGGAEWKAKVVSNRDGIDLSLESDLKGLASTLPAPFAKSADVPRALAIDIRRLGAPDEHTIAALAGGGGVRGRFATRGAPGAERWQAALTFGPSVESEPMKDGVWLYGTLPELDVDAWLAVFARDVPAAAPATAVRDTGTDLRGFDLRLGHAVYTQRDFDNLGVRLERTGSEWKGRIDSAQIAGDVSWNPAGRGRVTARLGHLVLRPSAKAEARAEAKEKEPDELPAIDIVAEKFDFKGTTLGRLELRAEAHENEWRIEKLDIVNAHTQFRSAGAWRRTGNGSLTTLDLKLDNSNLNALFEQFGYGDHVKRGQAKLEGKLAWPGFPAEFELGRLTGSFRLEAKGGQFAKIDPGAGKLLGLLSLQSIPRRVTFDFRDVFSDGFAFESITSNVKMARGILLTDDFEITGPAAFVSMSGEVSLPQETQKLTLRVVPEIGESVALAATLIGTPVLGLSTLVVSKLLQNPLGKVVAYEYQVTGSWDNPSVTRLSAPALPPKAAAAPAKTVTP